MCYEILDPIKPPLSQHLEYASWEEVGTREALRDWFHIVTNTESVACMMLCVLMLLCLLVVLCCGFNHAAQTVLKQTKQTYIYIYMFVSLCQI